MTVTRNFDFPPRWAFFLAVCVGTVAFFFFLSAPDAAAGSPAGRVVNFKGEVRIIASGGGIERVPTIGGDLDIGDMVQTGINGWAAILMADETLIQLNRNTRFILKEVETSAGWHGLRGIIPASATAPGRSVYKVDSGEMWLRNKNQGATIRIETPTISAGIRGTELNTLVGEDRSVNMTIIEGLVEAQNAYGQVLAGPGEMIYAAIGMAPEKRILVTPADAVQWTLSVPPMDDRYAFPLVSSDPIVLAATEKALIAVLARDRSDTASLLKLAEIERDMNRLDDSLKRFNEILQLSPEHPRAKTGIGWIALDRQTPGDALSIFEKISRPTPMTFLGKAVALSRIGRYPEAQSALAEGISRFPEFQPFHLQAASLKLAMRDPIGATDLLEKTIEKSPDYGQPSSLLSLIAITRGETAAAVKWARRGVETTPNSPAAQIVLSRAYQAVFDLDRSMAAAETAARIDPSYVSALVTQATLLFGANQTDAAMATITAAFRLAPTDPDVLNIRGFILLSQREIETAATAFSAALRSDPGLGEAHLGLALIHMRRGNIADAMAEITTAVLLEPRRSVFMSYWAKMLYQIRRFDRALEALDFAQKLDPLDPTPLLYRAIILRDLNRPTEAITALNRAIELNDNRAVYRSRFLLDRDLAVKNIDQTIIFQELGLNEWARSKALKSVKTDYLNSAGHTFLAGSLLAMNNRLRSGSSENLLGLMLQQANLNSLNSFQEYTAFFEKPSINGILTGAVGNHDTSSGGAIVYGALPDADLSFSSIANYAETDGWRKTNGLSTKGGNASVKWDPTPKDGFLLITSHSKREATDRQTDPYEYDSPTEPDDWSKSRSTYVTVGYHRTLSPETDLLVMGKHHNGDFDSLSHSAQWLDRANGIAAFTASRDAVDIPSDQAQGHLLHRIGDHQLILGALQQWRKRDLDNHSSDEYWYLYDGWWYYLDSLSTETSHTVKDLYQSYYLQDIWRLTPALTLEAALYYDVLKNHNLSSAVDQYQEKLNPRVGLIWTPTPKDTFRVAGFRYLMPFTMDRLDPTDIAGVPLFRNDYDNSVTEEYDVVWEHDWMTGFFSMNLFYLEGWVEEKWSDSTSTTWHSRLKGIEPAWNQLLWKGVGLGVRYRYLDITNDYTSRNDREDHLASVSLNYLHPCGIFSGISQSYRREMFTSSSRETETIWLTDLALGYKFPHKRGEARIGISNLFDHRFNWVVDDFVFDGRAPARAILFSTALYF